MGAMETIAAALALTLGGRDPRAPRRHRQHPPRQAAATRPGKASGAGGFGLILNPKALNPLSPVLEVQLESDLVWCFFSVVVLQVFPSFSQHGSLEAQG